MNGLRREDVDVGRPLLAAPLRRGAVVLLACCALFVAVLGVLVAHQTRADRLDDVVDTPIITWFAHHPGLASRLASPGSMIPAAAISLAIVVACLVAGRLNGAVLALVAVPIAVGLDERVFKPLFDRRYLGSLAYPSGHTTAMFAVAATVTVLLLAPPEPGQAKVVRMAIPVTACVLGCVVGAAVIGLRWHYFTDTVAGAAVGMGTVCGIALMLDLPIVRSWIARVGSVLRPTARTTP